MATIKATKRLVFCFDGTWNQLSADRPTNVVQLAQMVVPIARDRMPQIVYYDEGIGTNQVWYRRWFDGAFGKGMEPILREAYRFLIFNYQPGDEIFAFGFSRGAYTARSFVGFIRHAGILDVDNATAIDRAIRIYKEAEAGTGIESPEGLKFRSEFSCGVCVSAADRDYRIKHVPDFDPKTTPILTIRYLGVWDTVQALGFPDFIPGAKSYNNSKYGFHNAKLTSKIQAARHAVAIDELRPTFRATLFGREKVAELNARTRRKGRPPMPDYLLPYQEKWFPGVHGAVGGGGVRHGLSDGALEWVLRGARLAGLELRDEVDNPAFSLRPNPLEELQNDPKVPWSMWGPFGALRRLFHSPRPGPTALDEVALPALQRWHADPALLPDQQAYRPGALIGVAAAISGWLDALIPLWKGQEPDLEEYQVVRGDTLGKLAKARLGDPKRWPDLFEINRDRIEDPHSLSIGTQIRLPRAD